MGREADVLLRMLEPVVRPVGSSRPASSSRQPIEAREFESLLAEARAGQAAEAESTESTDKRGGGDPLGPLSAVDAIQNANLRAMLGGTRPN